VIEAKGKDKRGNGTAGATVTATFADEGSGSTRVDVQTDLAITGKPAQFGRGVIEDISNKLLQQFVTCLQDKVGKDEEPVAEEAPATTGSAPQAVPDGAAAEPPAAATAPPTSTPAPVAAPRASTGPTGSSAASAANDDALDLGATVLPILARTYGPQAAIALVALVIGYLLGRRRR
jgi:hypothetical protein